MVSITLKIEGNALSALAADIADAPKKMSQFFYKEISPFLDEQIIPLKTEPRLPTLPFIWSYDPAIQQKLRKKYFRTLPKGSRGGRYRRTHVLVDSWVVIPSPTPRGDKVSVSNYAPYVETVQGDQQYPSHKDSGWVQYDGVLEKASEKATEMIIDRWNSILSGDGP